MKKILILVFTTFLIFSCSENKDILEKKEISTWKTEISKQEIIPDEIFISSEENQKNKKEALECMKKIDIKKEFDWEWINQAFKYNWECYYFDISLNYWMISELYTTSKNWEKQYKFTENWQKEKNLKYFVTKINNYKNPYFKWCTQDKIDLQINILDTFDDIFKENNIVPPRIIYTEDELYNSWYFSFWTWKHKKEDWEKILVKNKENLENYKNFLNNFYKYKNSQDYEEISKTFKNTKNFILKKYLEWLKNIPEWEPKCYFFYDENWNFDKEMEKIWINKIKKYYIYDLEKIFKRKKELEKN